MKKIIFKNVLILIGLFLMSSHTVYSQRSIEFTRTQNPAISYAGDAISFNGGSAASTYVWSTTTEYDFSIYKSYTISFDAYLEKDGSIIVLFSMNKKDWNTKQSDALSISCPSSENPNGFSAVRNGMYKNFIKSNKKNIPAKNWHYCEIVFQSNEIALYVDNALIIKTNIAASDRPEKGFIGITQFGGTVGAAKYKNFQISY